jgi:soluble lytic murein transglycosylase-like protein
MGLTQIIPSTAEELGVLNPWDPQDNLDKGAKYLAQLLRMYDGNIDLALAAYNAGMGEVKKAGGKVPDFPETKQHGQRVKDAMGNYGG